MAELPRYDIEGEEWMLLTDVCEVLGIGRETANETLLLMMIEPGNLRRLTLDGILAYVVTDAGAFDIASVIPRHRPRRGGRPKGLKYEQQPLYMRMFKHYRRQIRMGIWQDGYVLPSSEAMVKVWGISRNTVCTVRGMLRDEGLVRFEFSPGEGSKAIVTNGIKFRSEVANGVVQEGRRALRAELEAFHA
ncbi:hypothetical protein DLE01_03075 [Streptomyces sp. FT05W]|nr:hypothetical protein [Streptomyces sp. FT05W]PWS52746.1 hypothetical protein DLE01_03075 [Streptomyces sp. FT05W]